MSREEARRREGGFLARLFGGKPEALPPAEQREALQPPAPMPTPVPKPIPEIPEPVAPPPPPVPPTPEPIEVERLPEVPPLAEEVPPAEEEVLPPEEIAPPPAVEEIPPPVIVPPVEEEVLPAPPVEKVSWVQRLRQGLGRSSSALSEGISGVFLKRKLDEDTLQDLEDILIQSDLGVETAMTITERLADGRYDKEVSDKEVRGILAEEVEKVLAPVAEPLSVDPAKKPHVILVVGVNGTGKTTTIGKLAQKLSDEGRSVMLAAGDTFRAAAIEQLKIWGERTGSPVIARETGADAAGLAFDALTEAKASGTDVLLIDTAGRLQNKAELMAELEKVVRVIKKQEPDAPHTVLLTLDATTGQNALNQVEIFRQTAGVTGLVMTKLDGTARGGILVAIAAKHGLPVHFIGVGESVDDLEPFNAADFARAIAGL
nr:signal recognition particle-docking protein FtsY [Rhodobium gokarnense]